MEQRLQVQPHAPYDQFAVNTSATVQDLPVPVPAPGQGGAQLTASLHRSKIPEKKASNSRGSVPWAALGQMDGHVDGLRIFRFPGERKAQGPWRTGGAGPGTQDAASAPVRSRP